MQVREELRIGRPADQVWGALADPGRVAGCIPGVQYLGRDASGAHGAALDLETGPGSLALEILLHSLGEGVRKAELDVRAVDRHATGRARGRVEVEVEGRGLFSVLRVSADLTLSGSLAEAARAGMLGEAIAAMTAAFAECLERGLDETADAPSTVPVEQRRSLWQRLVGRRRRRG